MSAFGSNFFICNLVITVFMSILLYIKHAFRQHLSGRVRYNLGFLMLTLLVVPFLPFRPFGISKLISQLHSLYSAIQKPSAIVISSDASGIQHTTDRWINDFSISVNKESSPGLYTLLFILWVSGMLLMIIFALHSRICLSHIKQSALPLQSEAVSALFETCRKELNIKRTIFIYSTAFCKSPFTVGLFVPRIYIPIHLISDFCATDMRYMLLHELQHYKHKDALTNLVMNLAGIVYWFHPLVWYTLKEMRTDREIACDSSVLQLLDEQHYIDYGNTLLHFAEKISRFPFPFTAGMGGSARQIKKRILNIVSYKKEAKWKKRKGICMFLLSAIAVLEISSFLPVHASSVSDSAADSSKNISYLDLTDYFQSYNGCFVLTDLNSDTWQIYNEELAVKRVSPNSTYKIYSALAGLETGIITAENSFLKWNGQAHPFAAWNQSHTLSSAMQNSVNWYFQEIDQQVGLSALEQFYQDIQYGNHDLSGGIDDFWRESSLQISASEQAYLLKTFYTNEPGFREESVQTVKNAMKLTSIPQGVLYGKTGTGAVNHKNVNGWFIGFVESHDNTYFFATNIRGASDASGSAASKITLDILQQLL